MGQLCGTQPPSPLQGHVDCCALISETPDKEKKTFSNKAKYVSLTLTWPMLSFVNLELNEIHRNPTPSALRWTENTTNLVRQTPPNMFARFHSGVRVKRAERDGKSHAVQCYFLARAQSPEWIFQKMCYLWQQAGPQRVFATIVVRTTQRNTKWQDLYQRYA